MVKKMKKKKRQKCMTIINIPRLPRASQLTCNVYYFHKKSPLKYSEVSNKKENIVDILGHHFRNIL